MMLADLPPSSCATRLTVGAAAVATCTPARVDPVKDTMSTSGCDDSRAPTSGPVPLTMLNTPAGTPAAWQTSANSTPDRGAISDGFSTMVQPAAMAGPTLQAIWFIGQFHGVINAQTPIPSRTSRVSPRICSQWNSFAALIVASRCTCPAQACASRAQAIGAPISVLMATANSSYRLLYSASTASSSAIRSAAFQLVNPSKAARAAAMARSASATVPSATCATISSVAGFSTPIVVPPRGATHFPLM